MSRITHWLKKRRQQKTDQYMAEIRKATPEDRRIFLCLCIKKAYAPLYFGMTALEAKNYIEGVICEETTGEWYHLKMTKIENPELLKP